MLRGVGGDLPRPKGRRKSGSEFHACAGLPTLRPRAKAPCEDPCYLVHNNLDVIMVLDAQGTIRYVSPSIRDATGYSAEERIGKKVFDLIHPEDVSAVQRALQIVLRKPGRGPYVEYREQHKNGQWVTFEGVGQKVPGARPRVVALNLRDITEQQRVRQELAALQFHVRLLSSFVERAREAERAQIARDLHDQLGQELTMLNIELARVAKGVSEGAPTLEVQEDLEAMRGHVQSSIRSVQRLTTALRPSLLDDVGLAGAIAWQVREFQDRTAIKSVVRRSLQCPQLNKEKATAVFRIFQEALTNVARHAEATRLSVSLGHRRGTLILRVSDNGKGISEAQASARQSIGIDGMRERALLFGGHVDIRGNPGRGTTVIVRVPIANET